MDEAYWQESSWQQFMNVPNQFHLRPEKRNLRESRLFIKQKLNKFKGSDDFLSEAFIVDSF